MLIDIPMTTTAPPVNEKQVAELEAKAGVSLPAPYREFLLEHNGGVPGRDRFETRDGKVSSFVSKFAAISDTEEDNLLDEIRGITQAGQIPPNLIPIAVDPAEDRIVLSVSGPDVGSVYYWAWGEEPKKPTCSYKYMRLIAKSFDEFLSLLSA